MNLFFWVIFGALVGWLGSLIADGVSGKESLHMTVYGIVGGIVGGWIANIICNEALNNFNIYSVLSAVVGAVLITWAYHSFSYHAQK